MRAASQKTHTGYAKFPPEQTVDYFIFLTVRAQVFGRKSTVSPPFNTAADSWLWRESIADGNRAEFGRDIS
jgi:hypothetical protein